MNRYLAVAFVLAASVASAQAPAKSAGIAGVVRDTAGKPLPLVTVSADGKDLSDVTGTDGRFFIAGLPGGNNDFTVTRGGFRTMSFTATLTTDSTLVLALKLHRVNTLATINITAPAAIAQLKRTGYYDRERAGLGSFLPPQHIDSVADQHQMTSQLLQDVNGLVVSCAAAGRCTVGTRRDHGCLRLFVDGKLAPGDEQIDDVVPIGEVAAMEIFANPNTVPTEFQGKLPPKRSLLTTKSGCGAIVVWTKARLDKK